MIKKESTKIKRKKPTVRTTTPKPNQPNSHLQLLLHIPLHRQLWWPHRPWHLCFAQGAEVVCYWGSQKGPHQGSTAAAAQQTAVFHWRRGTIRADHVCHRRGMKTLHHRIVRFRSSAHWICRHCLVQRTGHGRRGVHRVVGRFHDGWEGEAEGVNARGGRRCHFRCGCHCLRFLPTWVCARSWRTVHRWGWWEGCWGRGDGHSRGGNFLLLWRERRPCLCVGKVVQVLLGQDGCGCGPCLLCSSWVFSIASSGDRDRRILHTVCSAGHRRLGRCAVRPCGGPLVQRSGRGRGRAGCHGDTLATCDIVCWCCSGSGGCGGRGVWRSVHLVFGS